MSYHTSLSLTDVFRCALEVAGPDRLLFGTDSSFFPRGWHRAVYETQVQALETAGIDESVRQRVFGENFATCFRTRLR
jgi:predicted TIM-barrel fold metal-dependent hydrolase